MVRMGFGMRFVAALIDCVITFGVMFVLNFVILMIVGRNTAGLIVAGLVSGLAGLAYSSLEVLKAASPGKMIMKFRIMSADGSEATKDQLIKRWAIKQAPTFLSIAAAVTTLGLLNWVGMLVGLAVFVGCFMARQPEKQAFHDKLLGTAVFGQPGAQPMGFPVQVATAPATQSSAAA